MLRQSTNNQNPILSKSIVYILPLLLHLVVCDYDYKSNTELSPLQQAVVCTPEIIVRDRVDDEDMYLILACDGIWDVMSNEDVGSLQDGLMRKCKKWW